METSNETTSKKVLVVDDNPDAVNILMTVLKRGGYTVEIARNGSEALQKINEENPELILLDIMMPKMNGFEVCKAVKSDSKTRHITVLMITGKTDTESRAEGLRLGATDYLVKPIHPMEALRKVKEYL